MEKFEIINDKGFLGISCNGDILIPAVYEDLEEALKEFEHFELLNIENPFMEPVRTKEQIAGIIKDLNESNR